MLAFVTPLVPAPAHAQAAAEGPRPQVSLSLGVQRASNVLARDLYGPHLPVTFQVDLPVSRRIVLFAGGRFLRNDGTAVAVDPVFDESYPISFSADGIRAGALLDLNRRTWRFSAGGGITHTWYEERWPDLEMEESGSETGLLVQLRANRAIGGGFAIVGTVEYEWMPAKRGDDDKIDLGGLGAGAGIAFRF